MKVECEEKGVRGECKVDTLYGNIINKFRLKNSTVEKVVHVTNIFIVQQ